MIGRFPFNSCETTSLLLGKAIIYMYPLKKVIFVEGNCRNGNSRHFWIEVDGLCFDLTADQFKNIKLPFYGVVRNEHSKYFLVDTRSDIESQFKSNDFYTSKVEQFDSAVEKIVSCCTGDFPVSYVRRYLNGYK